MVRREHLRDEHPHDDHGIVGAIAKLESEVTADAKYFRLGHQQVETERSGGSQLALQVTRRVVRLNVHGNDFLRGLSVQAPFQRDVAVISNQIGHRNCVFIAASL
jgi:hypothetical protein